MIGHTSIRLLPAILGAAFALAACGVHRSSTSPAGAGMRASDELTEADLTSYATVMEAVQVLRPIWLHERTPVLLSPRSGTAPANPVWIYWDGTRLGDPSYLRRISTSEVSKVMHFDARAASLRWGINHENGVIYLVPAVGSVGPVFK